MKTNNVSVSIDIKDGDKVYKADWTFTEAALKEYKDAGLSRQRQITSLMMKMLQSELAIYLMDNSETNLSILTETPAESEVITSYLEPEYSFVDYSLDPEQQLPYQKRLMKELSFDASWMAPAISKGRDSYIVFITGFRTHKFGQVEPLAFQGSFNTFDEVDEFYNQTVKELLRLIDVN